MRETKLGDSAETHEIGWSGCIDPEQVHGYIYEGETE